MLGSTLSYDELVHLIARTAEFGEWVSGQLSMALSDPSQDLLGAVAQGVHSQSLSEVAAHVILHIAERRWRIHHEPAWECRPHAG